VLVGGLVTTVTALLLGWRRDTAPYTRFAFWTLLLLVFPAYWVMRIGAEWIYSKEDFVEGEEPGWVGIGYITADLGLLLLLISIIVTGIATRRLRGTEDATSTLARVGAVLTTLVLAGYVVAVWAMSAKPD
jgi:phosphoglycerol transferase MdoB-like AlkP superfamily enzyme